MRRKRVYRKLSQIVGGRLGFSYAAQLLSRLLFTGLFAIGCLSTSWEESLLTQGTLFRIPVGGFTWRVPPLLLVLAAIAGLWLIGRRSVPNLLRTRPGPTLIPVIGFGALILLRSWPVHNAHTALVTLGGVVLFWSVTLYTWEAWPLRWIWPTFAALILVQSTIALLQFTRQQPLGLACFNEVAPFPEATGASVIQVSGRRWLRAYGLTPHPNVLGGYLGIMNLVILGAWFAAPRRRRWLLLPLTLGAAALSVTFSRSAWLGSALGLLFFLWQTRPWQRMQTGSRRTRRLVIGVGVGLLLMMVGAGILYKDLLVTRLLRFDNPLEAASVRERVRDAKQAWMLIRNRPLIGVGAGYYIDALWAWANATGRDFPAFQHVHNIPLLATAELGISGALLWIWLTLGPPLRLLLDRHDGNRRSLHVGVTASFIVAFVVSLADYYLYLPATWWPGLYLGALCGAMTRQRGDHDGL